MLVSYPKYFLAEQKHKETLLAETFVIWGFDNSVNTVILVINILYSSIANGGTSENLNYVLT